MSWQCPQCGSWKGCLTLSPLTNIPVARPPAPAADGAGNHVFHLTNIRDQVSQDGLADSDYQVGAIDAAIAALRQPVPDAVREGVLIRQLRGRAAFLRNRGRVKSPALMEEAASRLESALSAQQESRNAD